MLGVGSPMILGTISGNVAIVFNTVVAHSVAILSVIIDDVSDRLLCLLVCDAEERNSLCCSDL